MNVENINKLIDHMESIPEIKYDQGVYTRECSSPMCVMGHADLLIKKENPTIYYGEREVDTKDWLGISNGLFTQIINGNPFYPDEYVNPTKQEAINMLKNLIKTGEVVWRKENEC